MTGETADIGAEAPSEHGTIGGASMTVALPTLVVAATHPLVADTVRTALASRGLTVGLIAWPTARGTSGGRLVPGEQPQVGIALSDIESESRVIEMGRLVEGVAARWVLLTSTPPGPLWGAALERGVAAVCPSSMTLDELVAAIDVVAAGGELFDERRAGALRRAWREVLREEETPRARMRSLSPREERVLAMLYAGEAVSEIAAGLAVSQTTVRSHVQSILRKLDVGSQLEAVALHAAAKAEMEPVDAMSLQAVVPGPRSESDSGP